MELPLRLLVSAVVVGLTVPGVLGGLGAYEVEQASARAIRGIDAVVRVAQQLYVAGGGAADVRVDFGGGLTVRVEAVLFGDAPDGPLATLAGYRLTNRDFAFLRSDPPVPMTSGTTGLRLGPGPAAHTIRVSYDGSGAVLLGLA